ncbi:MAG: hypothetical protein NT074_03575 [Methanomicrobiales archaeon]|nr:hypothetical protein [Methanomicrobiales archaeon]
MIKQASELTLVNEAKRIIDKIKKTDDEIQTSLKKLAPKKISDIDKIMKIFEDKIKGSDSLQLNHIHTSLVSEWQRIRNDYIKMQSNARIEYLNHIENILVSIDKLSSESSIPKAARGKSPSRIKPVITDNQLKIEYKRLESAILSKDDGPLHEYIEKHTKDELKQFCQINSLTVNVTKSKKDELKDLIRTEIIKNKVF